MYQNFLQNGTVTSESDVSCSFPVLPTPSKHFSDFFHYRLVLPVLEFICMYLHMNFTVYAFLLVNIYILNIMKDNNSFLLCVSVVFCIDEKYLVCLSTLLLMDIWTVSRF